MRRPASIAFLAFAVGIASAASPRAQIVAPPLERTAVELGYTYKWFHRDTETILLPEMKWEVASIYGRFGAFEWLTLVAEGGLWGIDNPELPDQSYSRWVIGGAAAARCYRAGRWSLDGTIAYNEVFDHGNSSLNTDKRTYGWNAGLAVDASFRVRGQRIDAWAGPMYVDDVAENYFFASDDPVRADGKSKWGVAAGVYVVVFKYVSGTAYLLQADHPQLRLAVALRSRGAK